MSNFLNIKEAVNKQSTKLLNTGLALVVNLDKDALWDLYLSSFPEGTNPIFRERTEHDCNCCMGFVRKAGNVVSYVDGKLETIWDVEVGGYYQVVADAMAAFVKQHAVDTIFLHYEKNVGVDKNKDKESDVIWDHFFMELPRDFVKKFDDIPTIKGGARNNYVVLKRSLEEITFEAIDEAIYLITDVKIYKGVEYLPRVKLLKKLKTEYQNSNSKEEFLWRKSLELGSHSNFRNSSMETLLCDLSDGVDLETAANSYLQKVNPENYKQTTSLVSQAQKNKTIKKLVDLGYEPSLERRHAVVSDVTINDVLFADRSTKPQMSALADMVKTKPSKKVKETEVKGEEVSIEDFISTVIPQIESMEVLVENDHIPNFMSLIAPVHADAKPITKYGNNFTQSYRGGLADSSMRKEVRNKGGNVDGVARFSIMWNMPGRRNLNDLDAHCVEPRNHIHYPVKGILQTSSGKLDVDVINPNGVAVENIVHTDFDSMPNGEYIYKVHNFDLQTSLNGFKAELEIAGKVYYFDYKKPIPAKKFIEVAVVKKSDEGFKLVKSIKTDNTSNEVYGIDTQKFHKVTMVMNSPNYWECVENPTGNKHYFFILENCKTKEPVTGFFNEFLVDELYEDRRVLQQIANNMKVPYSDDQLSGIGFSETKTNKLTVRVRGNLNKTFNVLFNS